jgi:DNA-binding response OmpR family regulator
LAADEKPIKVGSLAVDPVALTVTRAGKPLALSTLEFRLLHFLASHPNRVFSRDQLLDAVWGIAAQPRSVDACIRRLRTRIESHPSQPVYLRTIRGAGYKFVVPQR